MSGFCSRFPDINDYSDLNEIKWEGREVLEGEEDSGYLHVALPQF